MSSSEEDAEESIPHIEDDEAVSSSGGNESSAESDGELWEDSPSEDDEEVPKADESFGRDVMHADDISSDEEFVKNTIGNVPLRWYDHLPHIGYDTSGKKIQKLKKMSAVDAAIAARDDPKFKWTVVDEYNGEERTLTERQLVLLQRLHAGKVAHPESNSTPDYIPIYSNKVEMFPLGLQPTPSKKAFIPSKSEELIIARLQKGIREGRIKIMKKKEKKNDDVFLLWNEDNWTGHKRRRGATQMRMPKVATPGHAESYNPPEEYLPSAEERKQLEAVPEIDRPRNSFIPTKYDALRKVPAYAAFVKERFERCLDLYLCPAKVRRRKKKTVDLQSLVPDLPHPRELRPFPEEEMLLFEGHEGRVRSMSVSPSGQWLLTCGDDGTVRRWESDTGRCAAVWHFDDEIPEQVAWNPNPNIHVAAVAVGRRVVILNMRTANGHSAEATEELLTGALDSSDDDDDMRGVKWSRGKSGAGVGGLPLANASASIEIHLKEPVANVAWHYRGDYFATVCPSAHSPTERVAIHLLSRRLTQHPFRKVKGIAQRVAFHPSKPIFFYATKKAVRVYHLKRQTLIKKLTSSARHISTISIHPSGDHVVVGSLDRRLCWWDLDLSNTPFKSLQYHSKALRGSTFHSRYPLMASASDDGAVHVFHAKVYNDFVQNPLIVPVKVLRGHAIEGGLGVLDVAFHPTQPWLFSCGADGTVRLFQNIH